MISNEKLEGTLSDKQLMNIAKKMKLSTYKGAFAKDKIPFLNLNSSYIINLNNVKDNEGNIMQGSHWVCLYIDNLGNAVYMDSYGIAPPIEVMTRIEENNKIKDFLYNTKNIQSMMSDVCGYFCLAYIYYVSKYENRTKNIFVDTTNYLDLFLDLNKELDFQQNEYVLKQFFKPKPN